MPVTSTVGPSGDASGATDTAAIQASLDAVAGENDATVILNGKYYINATLTVASNVKLTGLHRASIVWKGGDDTSGYAIVCNGGVLANFYLECYLKRRGIHMNGAQYRPCCHDVRLYQSAVVGIYFEDCWAATFDSLVFTECQDIAIDAYRCNRSTFNFVSVNGGDYSGASDACMKLRTSDGTKINTFNVESVAVQNAVNMDTCTNISLDVFASEAVTYQSSPVIKTSGTRVLQINNLSAGSGNTGITAIAHCVTLSELQLRGAYISASPTNLVLLDGGTHTTPKLSGIDTDVAEADWIGTTGGAAHYPGYDPSVVEGGIHNVLHYGATGDGSTDDTTAVQAAIDAAEAAGGGTVTFQDGTYLVDTLTIDLHSVELEGESRKKTILKSRSGDAVLRYTGDAGSGQRVRSMTLQCYGSKVAAGSGVTCSSNGTTNTLKIAQNDDFQVDGYVRHPDETMDDDNWYRVVSMRMATVNATGNIYVGAYLVGATSKATCRVINLGVNVMDIAMLTGAFTASEEIRVGSDVGLKACDATSDTTLTLTVDRVASASWDSGDSVTPYLPGHGIHITGVSSSMSAGIWENLDIIDCQSSGIMTQYRPQSSFFNYTLRDVTIDTVVTAADHGFNVCGASINLQFNQCYVRKLRGSSGRPTFAFRVDSYEPLFLSCNAVDGGALVDTCQWGLFGAETAKDGYQSQSRPLIYACNVEHWLDGYAAIVCRSNCAIHARSVRWLHDGSSASRAVEFNYTPTVRNILEDCVLTSSGTGGWDTLPLWSLYNPATGDVNVELIRSGEEQYRYSSTNYDAVLGIARTVPTIEVTTGAEGTPSADKRRFTVQVKDPSGNDLAGRFLVHCWQSASNNGAASNADTGCTSETLTTGTQLHSFVQDAGGDDLYILAMTDGNGTIEWDIEVTGAGQRYMQFAFQDQQTQNYASWSA